MAVVFEASRLSSAASCAEVQPAGTTSENSTSTADYGRDKRHCKGCQEEVWCRLVDAGQEVGTGCGEATGRGHLERKRAKRCGLRCKGAR